ncbi:NfeD family protein [Geofilum sp. OHC36d9]|uniref:NfeD family protein n=1 Tax=Geofilum sp. OHC36d9 TaxID=3458413 RepID=UPI0040338291
MKTRYLFLFFFIQLLMPHALKADSDTTQVYRLPIFDNINSTTWVHVKHGFEEAAKLNADVIIVHLNTYGGEVIFADSIRTKILNTSTPVHVFIDNNAASAGALISIACDKIFMRPGANIGAATVVNQTGEQMPDKYQSYMRSTIRATAEAHGKDTLITKNDTIIKWIRDPRIAEAMVDQRLVIPGLVDSSQVLTFTALEAIEYNYCDGLADNMDDVIKQLGYQNYTIKSFEPSLYDNLKGFLNSPMLRGLLILIIIGGIYFEMQSPGIGFPLAIAVLGAILYFAPLYIDGLAANWEIIIFVIGIALIALEVFVIPGFGVAGVSGIILTITGLTLALVKNVAFNFENVDNSDFVEALLTVFLGMSGGIILTIYLSNKLITAEKGVFSKIALKTSQDVNLGYIAVDNTLSALIGKTGIASTVLRPSGKVLIEGEYYDARATDHFIEKNEPIKVISYSSGQLNVRQYVQKL